MTERSICAHCGRHNRAAATVCAGCGQPLAAALPQPPARPLPRRCGRCGGANRLSARFCRCCGSPMESRAASANGASGAAVLAAQTGQPSAAASSGGPLLNGRYRILRPLAQGGMGAVYVVSDMQQPGTQWALKEMDLAAVDAADQEEAVIAFRREAALLRTLRHPNLVEVIDHFSAPGPPPREYLVMECVAGETLDAFIRRSGRTQAHVLPAALQLCAVLDYLHSRQPPVIYRDLKPSNIMIEGGAAVGAGRVKLIDFGIARFYKPGKQKDTTMMGTPGFAPPEQYGRGQTDARSDLFALGVTLHVLLTDYDVEQSPWNYPPVRTLNAAVSSALEGVIAKATAMNVADRYQSAAEMRAALLACAAGV